MKKHWMKKLGILVGGAGALADLFFPGPWTQVGAILGGLIAAIGAERNLMEMFDSRYRPISRGYR